MSNKIKVVGWWEGKMFARSFHIPNQQALPPDHWLIGCWDAIPKFEAEEDGYEIQVLEKAD